MKKKFSIFISSTFVDLKEERDVIARTVIDMGFIPSAMEFFPATSMEQFRYIQKVIDDCDYYILVIGGRYGSVTDEGISYTEKEYDYAISQNKTVLTFIHENPGTFPAAVTDRDSSLVEKLDAFREKASTGRVVKFWNTREQLALQTMTSLHHAVEDYPAVGWVRGDFKENPNVSAEFREAQSELIRVQWELKSANEKLQGANAAIYAMFMQQTKPATEAEVNRWIEGARKTYPNAQMRLGGIHRVRFADKDFILPPLYGASATTVVVAEGVRVYFAGDPGHSSVLYVDGFRKEGML